MEKNWTVHTTLTIEHEGTFSAETFEEAKAAAALEAKVGGEVVEINQYRSEPIARVAEDTGAAPVAPTDDRAAYHESLRQSILCQG